MGKSTYISGSDVDHNVHVWHLLWFRLCCFIGCGQLLYGSKWVYFVVLFRFRQPFHRDDRLYMSESDVCKRQILTYKDGRSTGRINIYIMAVDP